MRSWCALLKPGVYQIRLSYNRVDLSPPTHEFVYRNKLHPYYPVPSRVTTGGDLTMKMYTNSFQFSPNTGPLRGDTQLIFLGHDLNGGRDYKCRFGGVVVRPGLNLLGDLWLNCFGIKNSGHLAMPEALVSLVTGEVAMGKLLALHLP